MQPSILSPTPSADRQAASAIREVPFFLTALKKAATFLLTLALLSTSALAQDTVFNTQPKPSPSHYIWTPTIPAAALSAGIAISFTPGLHQYEVSLRDNLQQATNGKRCHIDNVIQYAPSAAVLGLNVCGVPSRSSLCHQTFQLAESYLIGGSVVLISKGLIDKERPDGRNNNSFPSGHTFTAFVGAEMLRLEYGEEYPAIAVAGYAIATLTGALRIYNNRHWASDVLAGAAIGILSVQLSEAINQRIKKHPEKSPWSL